MGIFASQTQQTIALPFDAPNTVTVRKLTGRQIEAAQDAHRDAFVSGSARLWSLTFRRALERGSKDPDVLKAIHDPLTGYDRFVLVKYALVAWSYPQKIEDAIEDLDDETVDFIALGALRLTKPGLFQTATEAEDDQKKADGLTPVA